MKREDNRGAKRSNDHKGDGGSNGRIVKRREVS